MAKKQENKKSVEKASKTKAITKPKTEVSCKDINCPFHGKLKMRGRAFEGEIVGDKMKKTVTVSWNRKIYVNKYERYLIKRSKVKAHLPSCIEAKKGDIVRIIECRPLSKTKKFVVVKKTK